MILKTYPNKNIYGKYFLASEAPDDEPVTDEQPKPKRNVKVVSVKPSNRGKDFTQVGNPPITPDDTDVNDEIDTDDTDFSADTEDQNNEPVEVTDNTEPPEEPSNDEAVDTTDQPDTGENDNTDFAADDEQTNTSDDTDTGEDGPDVGGDEDFAAGADDGTNTEGDNPASDNASDTTTDNKITPPGVELDSTRKYNLYKEYMSLYNACDNYISKLENILKNDFEENQIIRISVNNLRDIKDILYDYMTIRFQLNTYVQSLLFYQKMVVAVQLVFNLLKSIRTK